MAEACWLSDGGRVIAQWQLCPRLGPARGAPNEEKEMGLGVVRCCCFKAAALPLWGALLLRGAGACGAAGFKRGEQ